MFSGIWPDDRGRSDLRTMRLLAHNDGHDLRGNERQLLHLARGLAGRGHEVVVSCRAGAPLAHELGAVREARIQVTGVRPRGDLSLPSALAFRRLVAETRPDAVLLTSWKRLFVGSWAARSAGVPRVVARLGIVRRMPDRGWSRWQIRRALGRVDALAVNSSAVRAAWLESAPWFPAERVRVIRSGVEPTEGGDAARLRRELGLDPATRLIVTVAALETRKGIDVLLRALTALPGAEWQCVLAGEGPEEAALRALARALALEGRVHWLGARDDVADLLAAASVFVLPSRQDSIPNALLEAMAAGVPVVTTAGNGAEEALGASDGRAAAGWIVPQEDPMALAAALGEALGAAGGAGASRPAEAAWRARHWFGVPGMVAGYERVLFGRPGGAEGVSPTS